MGSPGLFPWIRNKCPGSYKKHNLSTGRGSEPGKTNRNGSRLDKAISCDSLYIDANMLVHTFNSRSKKFREVGDAKEFVNVLEFTDILVAAVKPRKKIYISLGTKIQFSIN